MKKKAGKASVAFLRGFLYHPLMRGHEKKERSWVFGIPRMAFLLLLLLLSGGGYYLLLNKTAVAPRAEETWPSPPETGSPKIEHSPPRELKVKYGDTFESMLMGLGLSRSGAAAVIEEIRPVFNPRRMQVGRKARFVQMENGTFRLEYEIDSLSTLVVEQLLAEKLKVRVDTKVVLSRLHVIRGRISYSLFDAISALGERDDLADRLATLFEYDVDFNRDLRRDDRFALLVEKQFVDGRFFSYGRIHAAYLQNAGRVIVLGWHALADGSDGYFHPDGDAVEKFFLRCPLPFMRLTSRFGNRRHPVLGFSAHHTGIDLGAPLGTVVRSTASGRIKKLGRDAVRGLFLEATHPNGYETHYYHLSRLASGIRRGTGVSQGQIIAYVGNSGRSTGAHLHYGIRRNGRFINPLSLRTPPKRHLSPDELKRFTHQLNFQRILLALGDQSLQYFLNQRMRLIHFVSWLSSAKRQIPS